MKTEGLGQDLPFAIGKTSDDTVIKLLEELHYFCVIMYGNDVEYPYTDNLSLFLRVKDAISKKDNGEKDGKKISQHTKN